MQGVYRDGRRCVPGFLLNLLLIVKNRDNLCVMVTVLFGAFSIVKIDQHVGQVLVQSALDVIRVLLGLAPLLRLILLLLLVSGR